MLSETVREVVSGMTMILPETELYLVMDTDPLVDPTDVGTTVQVAEPAPFVDPDDVVRVATAPETDVSLLEVLFVNVIDWPMDETPVPRLTLPDTDGPTMPLFVEFKYVAPELTVGIGPTENELSFVIEGPLAVVVVVAFKVVVDRPSPVLSWMTSVKIAPPDVKVLVVPLLVLSDVGETMLLLFVKVRGGSKVSVKVTDPEVNVRVEADLVATKILEVLLETVPVKLSFGGRGSCDSTEVTNSDVDSRVIEEVALTYGPV